MCFPSRSLVNFLCRRQRRRWLAMALLLWLCSVVAGGASAAATGEAIPLAVQRLVLSAQTLLENKHYEQALALLAPARQQAQRHYLIDFTVANIFMLSGREAQAIPFYRVVVAQQPHYAPAWINLAQCHYRGGDYPAAAAAFEAGYNEHTPPQSQLLYNAALCSLQAQQPQRALNQLQRLLEDFPAAILDSWRAALVQVYQQLEQPQHSLPHLEILAEHSSGDEQRRWREVLIYHYQQLAMRAKALSYAEFLTREDGLYAQWWRILCHLHLEEQHYRDGLVALKIAGYLEPLSEQDQHLLADLYLQLGVPQQALSYYEPLLNAQPQDARLLGRLAHACLNLHQPQQALLWTQRDTGQPPDIGLLRLQGQLLFSLGRYVEAVAVYEQLTQRDEDAGAAWLMQGYAAWNARLWDKARHALTTAQQFAGQRSQARLLLQQLEVMEDDER